MKNLSLPNQATDTTFPPPFSSYTYGLAGPGGNAVYIGAEADFVDNAPLSGEIAWQGPPNRTVTGLYYSTAIMVDDADSILTILTVDDNIVAPIILKSNGQGIQNQHTTCFIPLNLPYTTGNFKLQVWTDAVSAKKNWELWAVFQLAPQA